MIALAFCLQLFTAKVLLCWEIVLLSTSPIWGCHNDQKCQIHTKNLGKHRKKQHCSCHIDIYWSKCFFSSKTNITGQNYKILNHSKQAQPSQEDLKCPKKGHWVPCNTANGCEWALHTLWIFFNVVAPNACLDIFLLGFGNLSWHGTMICVETIKKTLLQWSQWLWIITLCIIVSVFCWQLVNTEDALGVYSLLLRYLPCGK